MTTKNYKLTDVAVRKIIHSLEFERDIIKDVALDIEFIDSIILNLQLQQRNQR